MTTCFKNILVPVDFSVNTEIAIKKALSLVEVAYGHISLLHVLPLRMPVMTVDPFVPSLAGTELEETRMAHKRLEQWRYSILDTYPQLKVSLHVVKGNAIQTKIQEFATELQPEIIIIGKHNAHNWFSFRNTVVPNVLAKNTQLPVLTAKLGSLNNKVKSIVFPMPLMISERQMGLLITMAKKYRARVYLVMPETAPLDEGFYYNAFVEAYRVLRSALNTPVQHSVIPGVNFLKSALHFAEVMKADMILINPREARRKTLLPPQRLNDLITGTSKLEVLSVHA